MNAKTHTIEEVRKDPHQHAEAAVADILLALNASPHSKQFAELRAGLATALLNQREYWDAQRDGR